MMAFLARSLHFSLDGFVKSPSIPLEARLRCNFVVAAPKKGVRPDAPTNKAFGLATFYEIINLHSPVFMQRNLSTLS
jgi:hypothetical protein